MGTKSCFGSSKAVSEVLQRILEDLSEGPFQKRAVFSKTMTDMRKNVDMKCV
jgi:hypothetical protein